MDKGVRNLKTPDPDKHGSFLHKVQGLTFNLSMVRPAICVGAGIFSIGFSLNHYMELYRANSWPSVTGTVSSVDVQAARRSGFYAVTVRYNYKTPDGIHKAEQSKFDEKASSVGYGSDMGPYYSLADANSLEKEYATGSQHAIHVDPADPQRSFIDTNFNLLDFNHNGGVLTGFAFILVGVIMLFFGFRSNERTLSDLEKMSPRSR